MKLPMKEVTRLKGGKSYLKAILTLRVRSASLTPGSTTPRTEGIERARTKSPEAAKCTKRKPTTAIRSSLSVRLAPRAATKTKAMSQRDWQGADKSPCDVNAAQLR